MAEIENKKIDKYKMETESTTKSEVVKQSNNTSKSASYFTISILGQLESALVRFNSLMVVNI
jgi:hypothetical protein